MPRKEVNSQDGNYRGWSYAKAPQPYMDGNTLRASSYYPWVITGLGAK